MAETMKTYRVTWLVACIPLAIGAALLGANVLLLAVLVLGSSPPAVGACARWLRSAPAPSAAQLDALARAGFHTLKLQTYLTAGPKESRAWTIHKGWTAPQAAGVIHTDFQKGFIKAEIVSFDDLMAAGTMLKAKELGKVRMEGKDYVMQDGDVVEFRFNV